MLRDGATASYVGESLFDLLTRTALSPEAHYTLRDLAARKGILFLSTPFSREAADFLEVLDLPVFKTGSGELTNLPLQRHIAAKEQADDHLDGHVHARRDRPHGVGRQSVRRGVSR